MGSWLTSWWHEFCAYIGMSGTWLDNATWIPWVALIAVGILIVIVLANAFGNASKGK
jgi:hypothetical protein